VAGPAGYGAGFVRGFLVSGSVLMQLSAVFFVSGAAASLSWEAGARGGFDSNLSLSLQDGKGDAYFRGALSFLREPDGESRIDWHLASTLEGTAYLEFNGLNGAALTAAPGVTVVLFPAWTLEVSPFLRAEAVKDSEQSALTFGCRVGLWQALGGRYYTGEHYVYQDGRADAEIYSFTEHAVGVLAGANWGRGFFTEAGYEFAYGDSYVTFVSSSAVVQAAGQGVGQGRAWGQGPQGQGQGPGGAGGRTRGVSQVFGGEVIREKAARHSLGASLGVDWNRFFFSGAGYSFSLRDGDLGSAEVHSTWAEFGVRF